MDGNLIKEEYSSDSFSKDGWGDYDDDLDEEEMTNNKINQGIVMNFVHIFLKMILVEMLIVNIHAM